MKVLRQKEVQEIKDRSVAYCKNSADMITVLDRFNCRQIKRGSQIYIDCPFCGDDARSKHCSVSRTSQFQQFHCFACGKGGGTIEFYRLMTGEKEWIIAALALAEELGGITSQEYEEVTRIPSTRQKTLSDAAAYSRRAELEDTVYAPKAEAERTDIVYRAMLSMPSFKLNAEGYKHLIKRGLSDKEIRDEGYFSYTEEFSTKKLLAIIREKNPDVTGKYLAGVPGFYYLISPNDPNKGWWVFKKPYPHCLGIPIKNCRGQIVALQMRNMEIKTSTAKKEAAKYFYISSATVYDKRGKTLYGTSTGTPVDVTYPEGEVKNPYICIGEGKFKMREIAKSGSIALSVQGVNSFGFIADEIRDIARCQVTKEKTANLDDKTMRFGIFYDADQYHNIEVVEAILRLRKYLEKNFGERDIRVALWNPNKGKGVDDYIQSCQKENIYPKIVFMPIQVYEKLANEAIREADKKGREKNPKWQEKFRRYPEWKETFFHEFYTCRISNFL